MAIVESLLIALGTGIAKYLAKEALPKDWQDQIAAELVSLGVRQVSARTEEDPVATAIGRRLKTLYDRSALAANAKAAVLIEVIRTLGGARTDVQHLVDRDLNPDLLRRELLASRPDATARFSTDETALYEQMLREASQGMVQVAGRLEGFATAQARAQLGQQRAMLDQQTEVLALLRTLAPSLASWLEGPSQQAARFEREVYRPAVVEKLNKLEPFGIEEGDRYAGVLRLTDSFVEPDLLLTVWERETEMGREIGGAGQGKRLTKQERRLPALHALSGVQRLMVVGAAGSGKSTFLQWLAVGAAQQCFPPALAEWNRLVPFFIRLRDYQGEGFPAPEHFADKITPMGKDDMPAGWAREVLRRGDGLVLVDGVDEMRRNDRAAMLDALQELTRLFPLSRFVVTSRPPAVDELAWPEWRVWLQEAGFAESWLADMQWPQIEVFVQRWHDALGMVTGDDEERRTVRQNREGAVKLLQREAALRRLAGTPLLCAMICALYQSQGDHVAPQRLELYRNCVDMLLWERDRKHRRRKVPALADYHQFNKDHLLRLLSHLAYWMMDEGASAMSRERVEAQFELYLPNLGLDPALSGLAYEYFDQRASVWGQPADGMVEFRHRTFQEYLAAGWAMQQDKIGALAGHASSPAWRETIVLAAGRGQPAQSWALLRKILQRADKLRRPSEKWRYLLLLALDCLETCRELPKAEQWNEVVERARPVFPPLSREEAEMVANGGIRAVDLLAYDSDYPGDIAAHCIQALAAIGGDRAMDAIAAYTCDDRWQVRRAIGDAWSQFAAQRYAERVLAGQDVLVLSAAPPSADQLRWLPNLTHLDLFLRGTSVSDLSALAELTQLTRLSLSLSDTSVSDLSALAGLTQLTRLSLSLRGTPVSDLSALAGLTQLTHFMSDLSFLAELTQLTQLSLDLLKAPVSDLSVLTTLTQLTQFFLRSVSIKDLSALVGLHQLTQLSLSAHSTSDPIRRHNMSQYGGADLPIESFSDLRVLAGLPNLTALVVDEDRAADAVAALESRRQRGLAIYTDYVGGKLYRYLPRSR